MFSRFRGVCVLALAGALTFGTGDLVRGVTSAEVDSEGAAYSNLGVFAKVLELVRHDYVDEGKVAYRSLVLAALKGMLSSLDPHSQYLDPKEFKSVQDDTQGRFDGVGIVLTQRDGRMVVVSVLEGGPASRAGVVPGDQVLKIGDRLVERMGVPEAGQLLRGENGRPIRISFYRPLSQEVQELEMVREEIRVPTVKDVRLLPGELAPDARVAYVRLSQFNLPTSQELTKALDELDRQGMEALVLDLRYNPGGVLNVAVEVAAQFLPPNSLVVSTEGRVASQNRSYRTAADAKTRRHFPMAILINSASASAAEILAGALKDLRRAILVGETTFGKGSVQSVIPLSDGSAVRLTTAKYFTPGKQVIHERGIEPTIRVMATPEQERLLALQRREGPLEETERKQLAEFRDVQLERAVDVMRSVVLYSGRGEAGGVSPRKK
ncbi:MAG: hypothetical protein RLZZ399_139 [Verrucomicrobiota bacterium]